MSDFPTLVESSSAASSANPIAPSATADSLVSYGGTSAVPGNIPPITTNSIVYEPVVSDSSMQPFTVVQASATQISSRQLQFVINIPNDQVILNKTMELWLRCTQARPFNPTYAGGPLDFDAGGSYEISDLGGFFNQITGISIQCNDGALWPVPAPYVAMTAHLNTISSGYAYDTVACEDYFSDGRRLGQAGFSASTGIINCRKGWRADNGTGWGPFTNQKVIKIPLSPFLYLWQERFGLQDNSMKLTIIINLSSLSFNVTRVLEGNFSGTPAVQHAAQGCIFSVPIQYTVVNAFLKYKIAVWKEYMQKSVQALNRERPLSRQFTKQTLIVDPGFSGNNNIPITTDGGPYGAYQSRRTIVASGLITKRFVILPMITATWSTLPWNQASPFTWTRTRCCPGFVYLYTTYLSSQQWGRDVEVDMNLDLLTTDVGYFLQAQQDRFDRAQTKFQNTGASDIYQRLGWGSDRLLDLHREAFPTASINYTSAYYDYWRSLVCGVNAMDLSFDPNVETLSPLRQQQLECDTYTIPSIKQVVGGTGSNLGPLAFMDVVMSLPSSADPGAATNSCVPLLPTSAVLNVYFALCDPNVFTFGPGRNPSYNTILAYVPDQTTTIAS